MAEALASVLIELLATAAIEKLSKHVRLAADAEDEVKKLQTTFETLQEVLNDAEQRQFSSNSVKKWVDRFKDVAYDMEDVLDLWTTEALRTQMEGAPDDENDGKYKQLIKGKVSSYLCSPLSCFKKTALYYDIGSRIKEIREKLDSIQKDKDQFGFIISTTTGSQQGFDFSERPKTSSIILDPIFGRESDKEILLNRLVGETSCEQNEPYGPHNIISIIGMGGLGKTTLAQLLFNDDKVKVHFESTMWVCVSEPFDRTRIAQAIIHEATKNPTSTSEWNRLHHELIESVKEKRFLLVLDDVWTENENDHLNPVIVLLHHGASGSRIMLTTRNKNIGEIVNSYQHNLGILSHKECWSLISRRANFANFVETKNGENEALKNIGFQIAEKCRGLPLYASLLGSLLRKKKTEREWRQVLNSKTWELEDSEQKLFQPLLLSYNDLQPPLKRCFAFCAIFPKDQQIRKHSLIRMWMAQGFLHSPKGRNLDPQAIGENYFDDLAERSFFQDFSQPNDMDDVDTICYKMHDIVHDFAQYLTKDEFYVKHITDHKPLLTDSSKARHLTLLIDDNVEESITFDASILNVEESTFFDASILETKHLRSLRLSAPYFGEISSFQDSLPNLLCHVRCLRVLKLDYIGITRLPAEIKKLIHLRYLDLSHNDLLEELPDSICSLYNLETLKLKKCRKLCKVARGMERMINLIHLDIRDTNIELSLPGGTGTFGDIFLDVIGSCDEVSNIKEFKDLSSLQQKSLDIRGLGRLNIAKEVMPKKQQGVCRNLDGAQVVELAEGFSGVLIDPSLRVLNISGYLSPKLANLMTSFTHLRTLMLYRLVNCTWLPALGLLPSLEFLNMWYLDNLKHIGAEFYGICNNMVVVGGGGVGSVNLIAFPKLKSLVIFCIEELEEVDLGVNLEERGSNDNNQGGVHQQIIVMPRLKEIQIKCCPKLKTVRSLSKLESLEELELRSLVNLEEFNTPVLLAAAEQGGGHLDEEEEEDSIISNMSSGLSLCILDCPKLKSLQQLLQLPKLNKLRISNCSMLYGQVPTSLPNITSLTIRKWDSLPPKGLARFEKLQHLSLLDIPPLKLKFITEEVRYLTALQTLEINLRGVSMEMTDEDCRKQDEETCSSITLIPEIIIERHTYAD